MDDRIELKPISESLSLWKPSVQTGSILSYRPKSGQKGRNLSGIPNTRLIVQQTSQARSQVSQPIYTKGGELVSLGYIKKGLIVDLDV